MPLNKSWILVLLITFTNTQIIGKPLNKINTTFATTANIKNDHATDNIYSPPNKQITGLVTDSGGSPLPGVTVHVKNKKSTGTVTDINGRYILEVPDSAVLVFSMVGFETVEVAINKKAEIDVTLHPSASQLEETVIVGFGKEKKSDMIGAITSINPSDLKVPSSNLTTALAGRVSGLISYQRSGEPGADNAKFFIRGVTTFGYKVDPLILIDDVEATATDLARLRVDDIENFSILKDATATAIYGAKGANGVILIKTKEGTQGRTNIFVRIENSVTVPVSNVQLADPITYMKLNNEAVLTRTPLAPIPYSLKKIDNTIRGTDPILYPVVDWQKALFKKYSTNQRAYLSVNGGGSVARFYVSGSVDQDNGILKVPRLNNFNNNINLKNYSLRGNININLFKGTELKVSLNGSFDDYTGPLQGGGQVYADVMRSNPVRFKPYYNPGPQYSYLQHIMFGNYREGSGLGNDGLFLNPYANMVKGYKNYSSAKMLAQLEINQDLSFITEGLNFRIMGNTTRNSYFSISRQYNPFFYQPAGIDPSVPNSYIYNVLNDTSGTEYIEYAGSDKTVSSLFYLEAALNYQHSFQKKHKVGGLLVYTVRNELYGNAGSLQQSLPFRNLGLAGRFTYGYDNRYALQLNFGYNGSERFAKAHRFGFFPSAGIAWNVSNEAFWKSLKPVVSNLKFRFTYGLVGNDAVGSPDDRFYYLSEINMNTSSRGAVFGERFSQKYNGVSVERYSNTDITWETAYKTNIGIELGIANALDLTGDLFWEIRKNIFMTRAGIPTSMGLETSIAANVGQAFGNGIDISAKYNKSFSNQLWLKMVVNFTYAHSIYKVYEEPEYPNERWLSRVGHPISQVWGYVAERLFIDSSDVAHSPKQDFGRATGGDIKYKDINGDGSISLLDQVPLGYPTTPEINYGFGFSLGYKNWDFSVFFEGLGRESFWIDQSATMPFVNGHQLLQVYAQSHWSEEDQNLYAIWPRLSTNIVDNNNQTNSWFMRNGAFLRLKQLEFGYTLSERLAGKMKISNMRIYLNGSNLLLWSKFKLWDVEMAGNGLGYPIQRIFNIGLQVNF